MLLKILLTCGFTVTGHWEIDGVQWFELRKGWMKVNIPQLDRENWV